MMSGFIITNHIKQAKQTGPISSCQISEGHFYLIYSRYKENSSTIYRANHFIISALPVSHRNNSGSPEARD